MAPRRVSTGVFGELATLLFPDTPRDFPGRRGCKIGARAVHVLCAGILVGSYVFDVDGAARDTWFLFTVVTGCALLAIDLHESAAFLAQVRGLGVLAKLGVLAAFPWLGVAQVWVLAALVVGSVVISHAPGRVRYFVVVGRGKLAAAHSKG